MSDSCSTCWTLIRGAAAGHREDRENFARLYVPAVRAYLTARWAGSPLIQLVDDANQEVFVDFFQAGGALDRVDQDRSGGFRAFLYGIVRNAALRFERNHATRRDKAPGGDLDPERLAADEVSFSRAFDGAWARALMKEAAARQAAAARTKDEAARRRVELLHLRFYENLPIREIADRWSTDAAVLHHEYAKARSEFLTALREVVAFHLPGTPGEVERECEQLITLLG